MYSIPALCCYDAKQYALCSLIGLLCCSSVLLHGTSKSYGDCNRVLLAVDKTFVYLTTLAFLLQFWNRAPLWVGLSYMTVVYFGIIPRICDDFHKEIMHCSFHAVTVLTMTCLILDASTRTARANNTKDFVTRNCCLYDKTAVPP